MMKCRTCFAPATCIGAYEGSTTPEPACDTCCGHGNEDGWCQPLGPGATLLETVFNSVQTVVDVAQGDQ